MTTAIAAQREVERAHAAAVAALEAAAEENARVGTAYLKLGQTQRVLASLMRAEGVVGSGRPVLSLTATSTDGFPLPEAPANNSAPEPIVEAPQEIATVVTVTPESTIAEVAEVYLADAARRMNRSSLHAMRTRVNWLTRHMGDRCVADLTHAEVAAAIEADGKSEGFAKNVVGAFGSLRLFAGLPSARGQRRDRVAKPGSVANASQTASAASSTGYPEADAVLAFYGAEPAALRDASRVYMRHLTALVMSRAGHSETQIGGVLSLSPMDAAALLSNARRALPSDTYMQQALSKVERRLAKR